MGNKKIITRTILLISLVSFFNDIASEMLYPVMPVYLKSIGFSIALIGILEGIAEATAGISKGYFGNLSDKTGKRLPFVQIGYLLSAVSKPLMALFTAPLWIFAARTFDRLGKGIRTSARDAILSDETTSQHKARVFGFHRAFDTMGACIGPILALIYLYFYPEQYYWLFIIAFVPGLFSIIITFFIKERKTIETQIKKPGFFSYLSYWKIAGTNYKLLLFGLLAFAFFNSSDAFLLLMLKNQGLSDVQMIGVYIFYNLIYALLSMPIGILADKLGMKKILIFGLICFAIVYFGMAFSLEIWQFAILFFIYGIYAASTEGVSKALITNISNKSNTATAIGFYTSFLSIFTMLASSIAGVLYMINPVLMFVFSGIGVSLVAIYFMTIKIKEK